VLNTSPPFPLLGVCVAASLLEALVHKLDFSLRLSVIRPPRFVLVHAPASFLAPHFFWGGLLDGFSLSLFRPGWPARYKLPPSCFAGRPFRGLTCGNLPSLRSTRNFCARCSSLGTSVVFERCFSGPAIFFFFLTFVRPGICFPQPRFDHTHSVLLE